MISKALSEQKMRQFEPILIQEIGIFLNQLFRASQSGEPVNFSDRCKRLGVDIIGRFGFGYPLNVQTSEINRFVLPGLLGASYKSNIYIQAPMVKWFGLEFLFPKLYMLRMRYYLLLKRMVKERLAQGKVAKDDLFSYVMDAKDPETGTKINLAELVSEATFFFPAGMYNVPAHHLRYMMDLTNPQRRRYNCYDHNCSLLLSLSKSRLLCETGC